MFLRKSALFTVAFIVLLIPAAVSLGTGVLHRPNEDALAIVQSYLKASYARDYSKAYQYISSQDQRVWDEKSYARQFGSFTGFALELAQRLADSMQVWVIDRKINSGRIHYEIGYQVPTADELSSLLFDWDQDKLNALSRLQQDKLREALEKMKKNGKLIMIKGQETFDLIAEGGRWRIFYDWSSANPVTFKVVLPRGAAIDAQLLNDKLLVKKDEPFQTALKITNRSNGAVMARLVHHIQPRAMENDLEMIACGALLPIVLQAKETQEISSAYLIRTGIRPGSRFTITYEVKLEPMQPSAGITNTPRAIEAGA